VQDSLEACVADADAIVVANDAEDWMKVDWASIAQAMKGKLIVDGRNTLDADLVLEAGLEYWGVGRTGAGRPVAEAVPTA
jgi:UDPglucose 6-dehydrogenase